MEHILAKNKELQRNLIEKWSSGLYSNTALLANECNLTKRSVYCFLRKAGLKMASMSDAKRKYSLNKYYFDDIDTEEKAYFLGLLYADGYNNEKSKNIVLTLLEKDKDIIIKLNKALESDRPIKTRQIKTGSMVSTLSIVSDYMSESLVKKGCMQAKTFKIEYPNWLSEELHRHFIRGYFDGDGCVSGGTFSIWGTEVFLKAVQRQLMDNLSLSETKFIKRHKNRLTNITSLRYTGYINLGAIYEWFYAGSSVFLKRKKKKIEEYLLPHNNIVPYKRWMNIGKFIKID